jgi:exodeoxyribonuclease VII small subunit
MSKNPKADTPDTTAEESELDKEIAALSLEKCFEELEQIVSALENQTTSLEDSINMFERGMKLSKRCNTELCRMERRIQVIVENAKGETRYQDFESESPL